MWNVHRSDYQKVLYEAAIENGVNIRLGCPVASIDDTTASVTLKSGEVVQGDLIIGADGSYISKRHALGLISPGMKSIARDAINSESERGVNETGMDITRFHIAQPTLERDPLTSELATDICLWLGQALALPICLCCTKENGSLRLMPCIRHAPGAAQGLANLKIWNI